MLLIEILRIVKEGNEMVEAPILMHLLVEVV